MEDVSDLVNSEAVQNANIRRGDDKTEASQSSNDEPVSFAGFDDLYKKCLAWRIRFSARTLKMEWVRIMIR